ncbi:MAG: hypothetical protein Tsb008_16080 [Rhodothalassiaceae bacterium]
MEANMSEQENTVEVAVQNAPVPSEAKAIKDSEKAFAEASLAPSSAKMVKKVPNKAAKSAPSAKPVKSAKTAKMAKTVMAEKPVKTEKAAPAPVEKAPILAAQPVAKKAGAPKSLKSLKKPTRKAAKPKPVAKSLAPVAKDRESVPGMAEDRMRALEDSLETFVTIQQELMSALADSTLAGMQTLETLGESLIAHGERMREERVRLLEALMNAKTPEEAMHAQEAFLRCCYDNAVSGWTNAADAFNRFTRESTDPLSAQVSRMIDRFWARAA